MANTSFLAVTDQQVDVSGSRATVIPKFNTITTDVPLISLKTQLL
jgi:hypothetical protein